MGSLNIREIMKEKKLYSEYQPLVKANNDSIFAYEALMRMTPRIDPPKILREARGEGILYDLDTICIMNAIRGFPDSYFNKYFLFINIFPSTVIHDEFENFINDVVLTYPNIIGCTVFEINEDEVEEEIWNQDLFLGRLSYLRLLGFGLAFDDLPIVENSFDKINMIIPDFIKLDHTNSQGLSYSAEKQEMISYVLDYVHENIQLVLEGIETEGDLLTAKRLGVPLLQGYYISKPKKL